MEQTFHLVHEKKDQGGAKTSKQLSDPVLLIDTTEYQLCSFDTGSSFGRKWNIKVSQIPCDSASAPPSSDCLQYFTALQDTVKSFNFDVTTTTVI